MKYGTFRSLFWLFLLMAIAGTGIAFTVALNIAGQGWLWGLVAIFAAYLAALIVIKLSTHENVVTVLEGIIPGVHAFVELQRKKYEYRGVIDKVAYALEYYILTKYLKAEDKIEQPAGHYNFTDKFHEYLLDAMLRIKVDKEEIVTCIEKVAERLQPPVSSNVIELLYKEIFKEDTQTLFADIKQDETALKQLAWSLIQSGRLPPANENFSYNEKTVRNILRGQESFSLKDVREALLEEERIWRVAQEYHAFLIQNNAAASPNKRTLKQIQESAANKGNNALLTREFSSQLNREEIRTLSAMLMEGEKALKSGPVRGACRGDALPALTLTSLAMFFTEERLDRPHLKSAVCKLASRSKTGVKQHLAYLQAREELRPEASQSDFPYVSVQYVAENWERIIKKLDGNPRYNREMDEVQINLRKGNWWTRIPPFIEELFRQMGKELKNEIRETMILQKRFPGVEDILRRIFRGLKLETIERLLEAQTTIAYLLTFDGQEGNLAEVIDSLSFFDGGENRIKLEKKKVVKFKLKDEEKYFFQHYTFHTRLGVVPKSMKFEKFSKTFENDLIRVYENRRLLRLEHPDIDKFEIIIHRFGLQGRDRYGFDKVEAKSQHKHALPKIRDLFASSLTPEEILKAIFYEQPKDKRGRVDMLPIMKDILKDGTVWDFTEEKTVNITENAAKTLVKNDARLKKALLRTLHCKSLLGAATLLWSSAKANQQAPVQDTTNALKLEIQQLSGFKKLDAQANLIASNYVEMLIDIAGVIDSLSAQPVAALPSNTPAP